MNLQEHKRAWGDEIPPEGQRFQGVYPNKNKAGETVSWYASIYDPGRRSQGKNPRYTLTRDSYWDCCFAREDELKKIAGEREIVLAPKPVMTIRAEAKKGEVRTIADVITHREHNDPACSQSDRDLSRTLARELGETPIGAVNLKWAEERIAAWKVCRVTEETIKKKVGTLSRVVDWHIRCVTRDRIEIVGEQQALREKPINPLQHLPTGFAKYLKKDLEAGEKAPKTESRKRRLFPGEEDAITAVLRGEFFKLRKPTMPHGQPFYAPKNPSWRPAMLVLFKLLVNTAMRLREAYTLQVWQLQFMGKNSQIVLPADATKTDTPRTMPMTPAVQAMLKAWVDKLEDKGDQAPVFPMFWDGTDKERKLKNISSELSKQFRKVFAIVHAIDPKVEPLKEHDLRHEGTFRWVQMRDPMTGNWAYSRSDCRGYTGHKTDAMFDRYFNARGSEGAAILYQGAANDEEDWARLLAA